MLRYTVPALMMAFLLGPAGVVAQSAQHDTVEVIDTPAYIAPDEQKPDLADVTAFIVEQTNAFREKEKRPKVAANAHLVKAAQEFAAYMAKTGRYGHMADGKRPADRATRRPGRSTTTASCWRTSPTPSIPRGSRPRPRGRRLLMGG